MYKSRLNLPPGHRGGQSDIPPELWAGKPVGEEHVIAACGDERDWFSADERWYAHRLREAKHDLAVRRKWKLSSNGWDFGQVLVVGRMGAKKSVFVDWIAGYWYELGHPVFANASLLFGRRIDGAETYDLVAHIPKYSVVFIDEAHGVFESPAAMTLGLRTFRILLAGLRKKFCLVILASAMARLIAEGIRSESSKLYAPITTSLIDRAPGEDRLRGAEDPTNFVLGADMWGDFPFAGQDIMHQQIRRATTFGPPHRSFYTEGEAVRQAYLTCDSFEPLADAYAQQYAGAAEMHKHRGKEKSRKISQDDIKYAVGQQILRIVDNGKTGKIKASEVVTRMGGGDYNDTNVGRSLSSFGTYKDTQNRYDLGELEQAVAEFYGIDGDEL